MSIVAAISIFLLVLAAFAILRTKRSTSQQTAELLAPVQPRGLFDAEYSDPTRGSAEKHRGNLVRVESLLERGRAGDVEVLHAAHELKDSSLYQQVLDALVAFGGDDPGFIKELATTIVESDELRTSPALALRLLEKWRVAHEAVSVAQLLRIASLSDDAEIYRKTVEAIYQAWKDHSVSELTGERLAVLFESEFWVLSPQAQRSGASFVLKQQLQETRRLLVDDIGEREPAIQQEALSNSDASLRGKS